MDTISNAHIFKYKINFEIENMSFKIELIIDEHSLNVLHYSLTFHQGADATGRPSQKPVFKGITLTFESQKGVNLMLWMISSGLTKTIKLKITPRDGGRSRIITFYDAHLLGWLTNFDANGTEPLSETLQISAGGIKDSISNAEYTASWRVTYDEAESNAVATVIEEEEPKFLEYVFEDESGNEISQESIKPEQKITLVIQTEYAEGKKIKINLNDDALDFKYNNKVLENDTLKGINITGKETRIELIAIEQQ